MPRYKLTVAYDGTDFFGWQKQHPPPPAEPLRTAQGVLEEAVRAVVREPVSILGASRTDSGVHAIGQVAAFSSAQEIPLRRLPRAINSRLPGDMQVRKAEIVPLSFDPIQNCTSKGYRYLLAHGCARGRKPLFDRHFVSWTAYKLDAEAMHAAAQRFVGTHDFASFTRLHHGRESTVRTVFSCDVTSTRKRRIRIDISGSGFLHNMIRIIAGTLVDVGRGRIAPEQIDEVIAAKDRSAAGMTMPPEGLCLMWVRYGDIEHASGNGAEL